MSEREPAGDQSDRNAFLWHVHDYINGYIRFADTKAQLTIGWSTAIIAALMAAKFYENPVWPWPASMTAWARLLGLVLLAASIASAVIAIAPRQHTTQAKGYIFWMSILAHENRDHFLRAVDSIGSNQIGLHVAAHIYDLSRICRNKYWWVNLGIGLAFAGSTLSGLLFLRK